jgi:hypothetical protein
MTGKETPDKTQPVWLRLYLKWLTFSI